MVLYLPSLEHQVYSSLHREHLVLLALHLQIKALTHVKMHYPNPFQKQHQKHSLLLLRMYQLYLQEDLGVSLIC